MDATQLILPAAVRNLLQNDVSLFSSNTMCGNWVRVWKLEVSKDE